MDNNVKKVSKKKKKLNKICFDEEVVPQAVAEALTHNVQEETDAKMLLLSDSVKSASRKRKIQSQEDTQAQTATNESTVEANDEDPINPTNVNKKKSKRATKRMRHMELLLDKKIKSDINAREKSLNYLSKWKHSRSDWKFEKNRQMWLKQNMFNVEKVPDEFWDTLTEYFGNSKGNVRKNILDEALKIIESNENNEDVLFNRARTMAQCLQD